MDLSEVTWAGATGELITKMSRIILEQHQAIQALKTQLAELADKKE